MVSSVEGNAWKKIKLPNDKNGDIITFDNKGGLVVAGSNTLLLSPDDGQSWQALSKGNGDIRITKNGGTTYLVNHDSVTRHSSTLSTRDLCSVESATFDLSGRLYLSTVCEHTTQLWSVPITESSGLWHVRIFTYRNSPEDGVHGPRGPVVATERILVAAILPNNQPALLTTDDKGATWHPFWRSETDKSGIVDFDFIDERQGWMLRSNGDVLQTKDGGYTWSNISALPGDTAGQVFSLSITSESTGFMVGERGLILATSDGGRSWQRQISNTNSSLHKVAAADAMRAWAVGEGGTVLQTTDGGSHWRKVELNINEDIYTLAIKDRAAWLIAGNYIYRSS